MELLTHTKSSRTFFFYVVLLPILLFGVTKCIQPILPQLKSLKERYNQWPGNNSRKRDVFHGNSATNRVLQVEGVNQEPIPFDVAAKSFVNPVCEKTEIDLGEFDVLKEVNDGTAKQPQEKCTQGKMDSSEAEVEVKRMPLLSRFVGSVVDKILLLGIFVVGFMTISPYGSTVKIGKYIGLFNTKLEVYEYIDRAEMNSYGTFNENIAEYFQHGVLAETEPPHIGSTLELDMKITFIFILLNMLFYIVFESILSASPGKRMFGGVIIDKADDKIDFEKTLIRGVCGGALMAGVYFLLHLQGGLTNIVVVTVFFLLLDLPVLFTKRSLLDIITGTTYTKG